MFSKTKLIDLKQYLREYANFLGLPMFGIASPEPLLNLEEVLERRRDEGLESPFERKWQPKVRCRPDTILPSVRSIVCVGMPYFPTAPGSFSLPEASPIPWGIARFARGQDYHYVLKDKLELLADYLRSATNLEFEYVAGVDSIPLVERAFAYRAGLGWYGKNNLLINPQYGSWFVLGELLTNIPFDPDEPLESNCGDCEMCVKACPTEALTSLHSLDTRKCISCLTQSKQNVPVELLDKIGLSVFGCDICQEVCPWNRIVSGENKRNELTGANEVTEGKDAVEANPASKKSPAVNVDDSAAWDALSRLFFMSDGEFRDLYGALGFGWAGRELLRRNGALAIGNNGREQYIPALEAGLKSSSAQVHECSEWALLSLKRNKFRQYQSK